MRKIETFEALITGDARALDEGDGIYTSKGAWQDLSTASFVLCSADDEAEEGFDDQLEEEGLVEFFRVPTLQDILRVERRTRPGATLQDMTDAVNHYLRFDAFRS